MKIYPNFHLAYSTNIHPAETWEETFDALNKFTLRVRDEISGGKRFGIGLRLSATAARQLRENGNLSQFKKWLEANNCYVFTINGFPYGEFHSESVKENVFLPDWSSVERVEYTNLLFDILSELLPDDCEGSVSTMPVSFKGFEPTAERIYRSVENLYKCVEYIDRLSSKKKQMLHLGIEPEPLGYIETTEEFVHFLNFFKERFPDEERINRYIGINYDCCHFAVEFQEVKDSFKLLSDSGIKISKIHLSNAISIIPDNVAINFLKSYCEKRYLHQTIMKIRNGRLIKLKDLDYAIKIALETPDLDSEEWRIHFHIPIYAKPELPIRDTSFQIESVMDELKKNPELCSHFEIETYTFGVLPQGLKNNDVVDQLVNEYRFALNEFNKRGFYVE
ncbi:MAG: metabolite traffic protein EboE [Verrucomicrobiia bacterium]